MLSISKISNNRMDVEISGKIDSAQMTEVLEKMFAAIEDMEHAQLLYRIGELQMPTLGAIGVELAKLPKIIRLLPKIDRIAVVCAQEWIQTWAEIEGKLIPGLEMKSFDLDEEDKALEWLEA